MFFGFNYQIDIILLQPSKFHLISVRSRCPLKGTVLKECRAALVNVSTTVATSVGHEETIREWIITVLSHISHLSVSLSL